MIQRGVISLELKELADTVALRENTQVFRKRINFAEPFERVPAVDLWENGIEGLGPPTGKVYGALAIDKQGFTLEVRSGPGYGIKGLLLVYRAEQPAEEGQFRMMSRGEFQLAMTPSEGAA